MNSPLIYAELFWIFFRMSLISFGGMFGLLPELQRIIVDQHHWMTSEQFVQSFVVGQFVPGPNMAMCALIGFRVAGVLGALAAFVGIYSGPIGVMGVSCALFYRHREKDWVQRAERALRPLVFGLIAASTLVFLKGEIQGHWILGLSISTAVLLLLWKKPLGPLTTIFLTGGLWLGVRLLERTSL